MKLQQVLFLVSFWIISAQSIHAQNSNWEISIASQAELLGLQTGNHSAINANHRNDKNTGGSGGIKLDLKRKINDRWDFGFGMGRIKSTYTLPIRQDIRDLDRVIGFSDATDPARNYYDLKKIRYDNQYLTLSAGMNYQLRKDREKVFQVYLGLDIENRFLKKSRAAYDYNNQGNGGIVGGIILTIFTFNTDFLSVGNKAPSTSQKKEIEEYFDQEVAQNQLLFIPKIGFQWQIKDKVSFTAEPYLIITGNSIHNQFMKSKVGLGMNNKFTIRF